MASTDSNPLNSYRGIPVLVTGATGFIGRWVVRFLTRAGADVWATTHREIPLPDFCAKYEICAHWIAADLSKPGAFAKIYEEVRPETVFNLAGYGVARNERNEQLARALNIDLVHEITDVVCANTPSSGRRVQLVHTGSAAEYGRVPAQITEASSTSPSNLYGRTKLEGTLEIIKARRRSGVRMTAARLFTIYGPGERLPRLLPSLLQTRRGEDILLTEGFQQRDFTYVGDVAEGLLRLGALATDPPDIINLATGELTSVRDFVQCAADLLGLHASQLRFGALPQTPDEAPHGSVDTTLLRHVLSWIPPSSIREGIRQTVEFHTATRNTRFRNAVERNKSAARRAPK